MYTLLIIVFLMAVVLVLAQAEVAIRRVFHAHCIMGLLTAQCTDWASLQQKNSSTQGKFNIKLFDLK